MANKAYKFRIYPNEEQKTLLAKTFGCVRFIYNRMLADKIKYYEETKQKLNNSPAQYKKEFEWLKEVDSLALANAQMNLQKAYNNFFRSPKVGFPKFKSKKFNRRSYTTNCVNGNIMIENGYIRLPKIGLVKLKQHRFIPSDYKLKSVTPNSQWRILCKRSICVRKPSTANRTTNILRIGFFQAYTKTATATNRNILGIIGQARIN